MEFLDAVRQAGGTAMLIGGAVIDRLQGREVKDWDIEVYGLSFSELENILSEFGTPNVVGKAFGVIKIVVGGVDYDFSLDEVKGRLFGEVEVHTVNFA